MQVCARCGIVAPRPGLPCEGCGARTATRAPDPRGALYFVQVLAQFQCRGCGRLAPLDAVDTGGLAWCASCGLNQAVDPGTWPEGLAFAHAVGDLARGEGLHPHPRWAIGALNPHAGVGLDRASAPLTLDSVRRVDGLEVRRTLRLRAAPGHPLCEACRDPLHVDVVGEGQVRTRCGGCGATARYDVPAGVLAACRGLRGVLADPQRADLKDARAAQDDGVVALSCPGCGAPLRVEGSHHTATCAFCHLVCRVPTATHASGAAVVEPVPFWLIFGGPCARRDDLERLAGPDTPTPLAITPVPEAPAPKGLRAWLGFVPTVIVAGGMTVATGVALFMLMRLGILPG